MSFNSLLNKTATLSSRTVTANEYGPTETWSDVYTSVPCAVQPIISREARRNEQVSIYGAEKTESTHTMFLPPTYTITETWRATVDSKTYDIIFVPDAAGRGHHQEVKLRITGNLDV